MRRNGKERGNEKREMENGKWEMGMKWDEFGLGDFYLLTWDLGF